MKYFITLLLCTCITIASQAQYIQEGPRPIKTEAEMTFETKSINFGKVEAGSIQNQSFPFINDGTEPLVIKSTKTSCMCISLQLPKEAVKPGEKSEIKVTFTSKVKGDFKESIYVYTNSQLKPVVLKINGVVVK